MRYYFKKTLLGNVLMVEDRRTDESPGAWKYFFRRATLSECMDLLEKKS